MTVEDPIELLDVARRLPELARYETGGLVCLERRGRPWRLAWIHMVDVTTVTTRNGFIYNRSNGRRLQPADEGTDLACPLTQERLDYLIVLEAHKRAAKAKPIHYSAEQFRKFAPIARTYLEMLKS